MPRPDDDYDDRPRRDERDDYDDRPRRRRRDDDDDDGPRGPVPAGNGYAMASLTLGLLSVLACLLTGIPAIIFGILGLRRASQNGRGRSIAVAGIVCTVLTTILWFAALPYAVVKVRDAALRARTTNNAKVIGLAMQAREHDFGVIPAAYSIGGDLRLINPPDTPLPQRLMSWRTSLLPFMEEEALYLRYDRTQPWDSPRNQPVSAAVVKHYLTDQPESNETRFRMFTGPNTLFTPGGTRVKLERIPDGASNTLLVVEGADTGPWAETRDLELRPNGPLPPVGSPNKDGMIVLMADGSVRYVKKPFDERILRSAIDPADGGGGDFW